MSLKPASIQSFSSAWNQMVCTSKERHVGRRWGQGGVSNAVIVTDFFGQRYVAPDDETLALGYWNGNPVSTALEALGV